ncbi:MAG TPA: hypothetical protein VN363_01525 [Anaerolineales bacterium]|nr:hypothetical protein [Anaerolineales bacterium]
MLKWFESRVLWGSLLILGGILFLLQNLGVFEIGSLFWGLLFGLAGVFFLSIYFQNRASWWSIIPGFTMFGIALAIVLDQLMPEVGNLIGGSLFLGTLGLGFLFVYQADRQNWWALIPMGVLLTLAVVSGLDEVSGLDTGGIFFLGLGLTFALVATLPKGIDTRWAWIPAAILIGLGLFIFAAAQAVLNYVWPLALILVGGYMIYRTMRFNRTG